MMGQPYGSSLAAACRGRAGTHADRTGSIAGRWESVTVESSEPRTPGGVYRLAGRPVARMAYGLGQLTRRVAAGGDRASAIALLRRAFDLGVRHFDTA